MFFSLMDLIRKIVNPREKRCNMYKCFRKKYIGDVCLKHKCKRNDCSRAKFNDKLYCSRHCCSAYDCVLDGRYEFANNKDAVIRLCHNHLCNYNGYPKLQCSNINMTKTVYCAEHTCRYDKCYSPVSQHNALLCRHHTNELNKGYIKKNEFKHDSNNSNDVNKHDSYHIDLEFRFRQNIISV